MLVRRLLARAALTASPRSFLLPDAAPPSPLRRRALRADGRRRRRGGRRRRAACVRPAQRSHLPRAAAVLLARRPGGDELRVPDRRRPVVQLVRAGSTGARGSTRRTPAPRSPRPCRTAPTGGACAAATRRVRSPPGRRPRSIRKAWRTSPQLRARSGVRASPSRRTPLTLSWSPVPRAASYLVSLATDQDLASLVGDKTIETTGTSFRPVLTPTGDQGQDLLLGRDAARRAGQPRRAVPHRLVRLGLALADGREADRPPRRARDVRPAVLVEPGRRRRSLRGRGELVARLRTRLEGVLRQGR